MPCMSASDVVFHEEALYQVYVPLRLPSSLLETKISVNVSYEILMKEYVFTNIHSMLDRKPLNFAGEKFYQTDRKTVGLFRC